MADAQLTAAIVIACLALFWIIMHIVYKHILKDRLLFPGDGIPSKIQRGWRSAFEGGYDY